MSLSDSDQKRIANGYTCLQSCQRFISYLTTSVHYGLRNLKTSNIKDSEKMKVESNIIDAVLEIAIDSIDKDFDHTIVRNPFIRIHICNEESGRYVTAVKKEHTPYTPKIFGKKKVFVESRGYTALSGVMEPKKVQETDSNEQDHIFIWEDQIVINASYKTHILDKSTIFLFEVLDAGNTNQVPSPEVDDGSSCIAWGFLKPIGRQGRCNVGESQNEMRRCRLQLFKYQINSMLIRHQARHMDLWPDLNVPKIFLQYLRRKHIPLESSLYIKVGPTQLDDTQEETPTDYNKLEEGKSQENSISGTLRDPILEVKRFSRLPDEKCLIPDSLLHKLEIAGSVILKFSHSGDYLAIASKTYRFYIYDVERGKAIFTSSQCHGEEIVFLDWCYNDIHIFSAGLDGTIVIHKLGDHLDGHGSIDPNGIQRKIVSLPPPSCLTSMNILRLLDSEEPNMCPFLIIASNCTLKMWDTSKGIF